MDIILENTYKRKPEPPQVMTRSYSEQLKCNLNDINISKIEEINKNEFNYKVL